MSKNILLVDDDSSIREALSKVLHAEDYEVFSAENGRDAIEAFKLGRMDLALLDLGLPVKDGWRALEWLARVNPYLPVIIITGRNNQRELAEKMGVDAIMEKPLDVPRLLQLIRELINEPVEYRAHFASKFRYVPCDYELYLKELRESSTAPFVSSRLKNH